MERIKQALERAREEREAGANSAAETPAPSPGESDAGPAAQATASSRSRSGETEAIRYTHTQSVAPRMRALMRHRVLNERSAPEIVAAYNVLRTKVLQRLRANGWNALSVTSPGANAGKTLTAVNLSLSLARDTNHTVLLVDLDLRRPKVHRYFDHEPEHGISDFLLHGTPVPEILFTPDIERLVVMPGRESIDNSSEMLSSPAMLELVEELKSRYASRLIIFDLPPVLSADDAMAFSPYVDATLLVLADGKTSRAETQRALEHLTATNVIGTVLNQAREPENPQSYY